MVIVGRPPDGLEPKQLQAEEAISSFSFRPSPHIFPGDRCFFRVVFSFCALLWPFSSPESICEDQMDLARSQGILKQLWSSFAVSSEALTLGPSTGCWSARTFVHLGFGGVEGVVIRGSPNNSPS